MVDIAQGLHGWTQSVYRFGCAFIHLSEFHNHLACDPLLMLTDTEKQSMLEHLKYYHNWPSSNNLSLNNVASYLPKIFDKITENLKCYVEILESGELLNEET
ncbi:MAG: hypothetical protein HQM03_21730 [Magnetococcales bacterium]|nr:hypothetical protein [Magnetococcales bacterium]